MERVRSPPGFVFARLYPISARATSNPWNSDAPQDHWQGSANSGADLSWRNLWSVDAVALSNPAGVERFRSRNVQSPLSISSQSSNGAFGRWTGSQWLFDPADRLFYFGLADGLADLDGSILFPVINYKIPGASKDRLVTGALGGWIVFDEPKEHPHGCVLNPSIPWARGWVDNAIGGWR